MPFITSYDLPELGAFMIVSDGTWIEASWFERDRTPGFASLSDLIAQDDLPVFDQARRWLDRYVAGEQPKGTELPMHLTGSGFETTLWTVMQELVYGKTVSSEALSIRLDIEIGATRPAHQIEQAVAACPAALFVPAHRVVDSEGRLVGDPAYDDTKRALLAHEGVALATITTR